METWLLREEASIFKRVGAIIDPVIDTVKGLQFSVLIAFAVITESIYAWPGMGRLIIESITLLDRPVIVAYLLVTVFIFMLVNLIVDILIG